MEGLNPFWELHKGAPIKNLKLLYLELDGAYNCFVVGYLLLESLVGL